jgi:hypothetical protein
MSIRGPGTGNGRSWLELGDAFRRALSGDLSGFLGHAVAGPDVGSGCPSSCPRCAGAGKVVIASMNARVVIGPCPAPWRKR